MRTLPRPLRVVRMQVGEVLSGVAPGQKEIEIVTGQGGGDCGYPFQPGMEYVVYAHTNTEGRLEANICSRTRELAQAAEDIQYLRSMASAPATSEIRVLTGYPGVPGKPGARITVESGGARYSATTDAAGDARFTGLPPGEYAIHAESDGDLPEDPRVQLHAKGCLAVTLFRTLLITGRVMTRSGLPAARVEVQVRSTQSAAEGGIMTGLDGRYELRIVRPGQYYLGINLNHTRTHDTPYPRWFYPGTKEQALAAVVDFSGKPDVRTYDFTLLDRQADRVIEGIVLRPDGHPAPVVRLSAFDSSQTIVAHETADPDGRFKLRVFAETPYQLHAVWPGSTAADAMSAVPTDLQPGSSPLSLRLTLTQPGNSLLHVGKVNSAVGSFPE